MYAEKAGVSAQAEALSQKAPFVAPSSGASCQASHVGPSQKDLQDSQPSTKVRKAKTKRLPKSMSKIIKKNKDGKKKTRTV